jgi:excisionase family DNA binding protein
VHLEQIQEIKSLMCDENFNRFISVDEAANYLGIKKSWIYQNHKLVGMPSYKLNQKLLFKINELDSWMKIYSTNNNII